MKKKVVSMRGSDSLKKLLRRPLTHDIVHHCAKCDQPFPPNPVHPPQPGEKPRGLAECPSCGHRGCHIQWVKRGALSIGDEKRIE
jgi:DNA-directed RNA polymerase subunit RPC12/RpoP